MLGDVYRPGSLWHLKIAADDKGGIFVEPEIIKMYAVELRSVRGLRQLSLGCLGDVQSTEILKARRV